MNGHWTGIHGEFNKKIQLQKTSRIGRRLFDLSYILNSSINMKQLDFQDIASLSEIHLIW